MSESLYHGTDNKSKDDIINNGIVLDKNPRGGDFAVGFYLTPNLNSAKSMALRKSFSNQKPSVIELTLVKNYTKKVKVKNFGNITTSTSDNEILLWAQFIVNNRCGNDYINKISSKYGLDDNNLDKRYDIVIGTTADGNVTQAARKCKNEKRLITLVEAKEFLEKNFGLQYCISTKKGLSMIQNQPREKKGVSWR